MSDGPLSPEEVAHRGFPTAFRGFETGEVRAYLQRVANELRTSTARERDLLRRLAEAEHRAAHPVIEGETLTRALGDEMGRILASAQEAAAELRAKAEENAARILREAHEQAQRIRAKAEVILAERTEEAEGQAAEIRRAAAVEAAAVIERARREAGEATTEAESRGRQVVHEAQAARARVLGDLTRRRRLLQVQVEQLRAGRERLLDAYRLVRRSIDEVADELQRAEGEARDAATAAGDRVGADVEDLDDVLAAFPPPVGTTDSVGAEAPNPDLTAVEELLESEATPEPPAAEPSPAPAADDAEPASGEPPGGEPPGDTPRPSPLRLLRRPRGDARPGQLEVAGTPSPGEGVRVIATRPGAPATTRPAAPPVPTEAPPDEPSPAVVASAAADTGEAPAPSAGGKVPAVAAGAPAGEVPPVAVDELFARIRAGRADAVAKAHEVLGAQPTAGSAGGEAAATEPQPAPERPGADPAGGEETVLQRRDSAVEGLEPRLARKLKRALQDEQNELLDRLRSARAGAGVEEVVGPSAEQTARYAQAAGDLLQAAAAAGAGFTSEGSNARPPVDDLVAELTASITEPLRRALERVLSGESGADPATAVERIGAVYRECKAQRIEGVAGDAVTAAFARGALAALPPGASSRWVVDDDGRPCPDCDDNALAGPTPPGQPFPTGQVHPPAHAGCRCVLARAEVTAAVNGSG